jgi:hypothetical protein
MQIVTGHRIVVLSLLVAVVAGTGCVSAAAGAPSSITCHTQYRPDEENLRGASERSLTVERADDISPRPQALEFATLMLEVAYQGDAPEGRNVTVVVTTPDGEPVVRDLYQFTDGTELNNEFAGGHGFTGLQYVFHEGSSLQVWCDSDDA